jgi:hypothetical protein
VELLRTFLSTFRTVVRRKENAMLIFLGLFAALPAAAALRALRRTLASLPRSNRDWIFY